MINEIQSVQNKMHNLDGFFSFIFVMGAFFVFVSHECRHELCFFSLSLPSSHRRVSAFKYEFEYNLLTSSLHCNFYSEWILCLKHLCCWLVIGCCGGCCFSFLICFCFNKFMWLHRISLLFLFFFTSFAYSFTYVFVQVALVICVMVRAPSASIACGF